MPTRLHALLPILLLLATAASTPALADLPLMPSPGATSARLRSAPTPPPAPTPSRSVRFDDDIVAVVRNRCHELILDALVRTSAANAKDPAAKLAIFNDAKLHANALKLRADNVERTAKAASDAEKKRLHEEMLDGFGDLTLREHRAYYSRECPAAVVPLLKLACECEAMAPPPAPSGVAKRKPAKPASAERARRQAHDECDKKLAAGERDLLKLVLPKALHP